MSMRFQIVQGDGSEKGAPQRMGMTRLLFDKPAHDAGIDARSIVRGAQ